MNLSIIVCTYNRSRLLKKCLESLVVQSGDGIEILVIDNNSQDDTAHVVNDFLVNDINIRYFFEDKVGLSNARNRGIKESRADWILFLDDDAIAFPDLVDRSLYLVDRGDFDCVGGMYYGYYNDDKPKWISEKYGTKNLYSTELSECPFYEPHGGIVLYRKKPLKFAGYFDPKSGMVGNKISYGEEIEIQKKIFELNGRIGFDPNLKVWHLTKRTTIKEQLIVYFELGKSHRIRFDEKLYKRLLLIFISLLEMIFYRPFSSIYKVGFVKNYYWQNAVIEVFGQVLYLFGRL